MSKTIDPRSFGAAADGKYTLKVYVDGIDVGDSLKAKIVSGNTDEITPVGSRTEVVMDSESIIITMNTSRPANGLRQQPAEMTSN